MSKDSSEVKALKQERLKLKADLKLMPMKEQYTEYVKIERRIIKIEKEILDLKENDAVKNFINYGLNLGLKVILVLSLFFVTVFNRRYAVIVFSKNFDFSPFSGLISFPSNIENSVSLPFWVFVNNFVFRHLASKVK